MRRIAVLVWAIAFGVLGIGNAHADDLLAAPANVEREVVADRTATSKTWKLRNGEQVTKLSQGIVHWKDGDTFRSVDTTFDLVGDDFRAKVGPGTLEAPVNKNGQARLQHGDAWLRVRLRGLTGDAQRDSDGTLRYQLGADAEARLTPIAYGVKEAIELREPRAPRSFNWELQLSAGLEAPQIDAMGRVVVARDGEPEFVMPAPVVTDASGKSMPGAAFSVDQMEGGWRILLRLDDRWVEAQDRVWPVIVDPTVTQGDALIAGTMNGLCEVGLLSGGSSCPAAATVHAFSVGSDLYNGTTQQWLLSWALPAGLSASDDVGRATLKLNRIYGTEWFGQPAPGQLQVHRLAASFSAGSLTSFNWSKDLKVATATRGQLGAVDLDMTQLVRSWHRHTSGSGSAPAEKLPAYGVALSLGGQGSPPSPDPEEFPDDLDVFAGPGNPDLATRPVLEIRYRKRVSAPANDRIESPEDGTVTARRVTLQAKAQSVAITNVHSSTRAPDSRSGRRSRLRRFAARTARHRRTRH